MEHPVEMLLLTLALIAPGAPAWAVAPFASLVGGPLAATATMPLTCGADQAE